MPWNRVGNIRGPQGNQGAPGPAPVFVGGFATEAALPGLAPVGAWATTSDDGRIWSWNGQTWVAGSVMRGQTGQGVLALAVGAPVPEGTTPGTVIVRF
jgi:hypothetical protein